MKYTHIHNLDIPLSNLGLGGEQLGGHGWGNTSDKEMERAIHTAFDNGITLFDTAPIYGLGHSEKLLGKTLKHCRAKVIIATKVGLRWHAGDSFRKYPDSSPANIESEIDASLKRLKTDYIDVYQIHWHDPDTPLEQTCYTMDKLRQSGKIRLIGCCNFSLSALQEAMQYCVIDTIQVPFNLIDRQIENEMLPFCAKNNIKVLTYSPLARGLFSGKYNADSVFSLDDSRSRDNDKYFNQADFTNNLKVLDKVQTVAHKLNKTPTQVAIQWCLTNNNITSVIFGAKNSTQVRKNVDSVGFTIPTDDIC